jgi:PBP1b-binding outer membrane lipoprotein LpoB
MDKIFILVIILFLSGCIHNTATDTGCSTTNTEIKKEEKKSPLRNVFEGLRLP